MRRWLPLLLASFVAACGRESTTPSVDTAAFDLPAQQVAVDVEQTITNKGIRTAVLRSDTAYIHVEDRRLDLVGVNVVFYGDSGAEAGTLTSKTAQYNTSEGEFVALGNVVLLTGDPGTGAERRLETESLTYDIQADSLWTTVPFTLHEEGRVVTGTSFHSDSNLQTWEVTGAQTEGTVQADLAP